MRAVMPCPLSLWALPVTSLPETSAADVQVVPHASVPTPVAIGVTLSGPAATTVRVRYRTVGGTAVDGVDDEPTDGELVFQPGETGPRPVTVRIAPRAPDQPRAEMHVVLDTPQGAVLGHAAGRVTIGLPATPGGRLRRHFLHG